MIVPSSVSKRNTLVPVFPPELIAKSVVVLKTFPVGAAVPPATGVGMVTTSGEATGKGFPEPS